MKILVRILSLLTISTCVFAQDNVIDRLRITSGNESENEKRILASEVLIGKSEERALKHLNDLIKRYKGTSLEPELRFRLAELYMSRAKSARVISQIADDQGVLTFLPGVIKSVKEKSMIEKAISYYISIGRDFPKFRGLDRVIFNKAFAQLQISREIEAEQSFIELLKKMKRSSLRPDAFLAVGEINFKRRQFKRALAYFNQVKKFKSARVYPYGLYKAGWSYYNLQAYEQAISELEAVIQFGKEIAATGADSRLDLRNEALMDLALFYSGVRSASDAIGYFKEQAGDKDPIPALRKLASIHEKHGRDTQQEIVLVDMVKDFPNSDRRPLFHNDLVKNYDRQNKFKLATKNLWAFLKTCKREVAKAKQEKKELEFDCLDDLDTVSRRMAIKWLKMYKRDNTKKLMSAVAEQAFRVHLYKKKPLDENSEMRFLFAEHLFERKKFDEASKEYDKVGDSTKDKEKKHTSRYASIFSLDKVYNGKFEGEGEKRYRTLSAKYMKDFPKGERYLDVAFKLGLFDYTNKNYQLAGPLLLDLGKRFYKEGKGKKAQDLYLDILNSSKKYIDIQKYAKDWRNKETDTKRKSGLQSIYEQAFFKEVQGLEEAKEFKRAIVRYNEFIGENPNSVLADEAQWNIIGLHFKLKDYASTARAYVGYFKKYPKDRKSIPGLVKALEIFEMMAEPEQALSVARILAKADLKNRTRWSFLEGSYLQSSGRYEDAAKRYLQIFQGGASNFRDVARVEFFKMADTLGVNSVWFEGQLRTLSGSSNREIASLAVREHSKALYRKGDVAGVNNQIKKYKLNRNLDQSKIGILSQYAGEKREKRFFGTVISNTTLESIVSGIQKKTTALDRVQTEYQRALSDQDPKVVIKALLGLGRTYQRFVEDLKNIKPPSSFSAEESEALAIEVENLIIPFEEKAAEAVDQALQVATESNLRDGSIQKVQVLLDAVNLQPKNIYPVKVSLPEALGPRGL